MLSYLKILLEPCHNRVLKSVQSYLDSNRCGGKPENPRLHCRAAVLFYPRKKQRQNKVRDNKIFFNFDYCVLFLCALQFLINLSLWDFLWTELFYTLKGKPRSNAPSPVILLGQKKSVYLHIEQGSDINMHTWRRMLMPSGNTRASSSPLVIGTLWMDFKIRGETEPKAQSHFTFCHSHLALPPVFCTFTFRC